MCVISRKPVGATISEETLKKMWDKNSDGGGFIGRLNANSPWVHKKGLMTYDEAKTEILPYLGEEAEIILHFRIKSKGDINKEMTHPFEWSRNSKENRLLFHNGTVRLFTGHDGCSDSSALADLLRPVGTKSAHKILTNLVKDNHGRFVSFVQKEGKDAEIEVFEDNVSEWKDGVWYSNLKHLEETKVTVFGAGAYNEHSSYYRDQQNRQRQAVQTPLGNLNSPLVKKVVDFYIKKRSLQDTLANRNKIIEHYSISIMCEDFLTDICAKIDEGKDSDPILNYFEL